MSEEYRRKEIPFEVRKEILERDGYRCRYCGTDEEPFELDHVYPYSKGGETTKENLVTACLGCNGKKRNKVGIWPRPINSYGDRSKTPYILLVCLCLGLGIATTPLSPTGTTFSQKTSYLFVLIGVLVIVISVIYTIKKRLH